MKCTLGLRISQCHNVSRRMRPALHRYREVSRWQREAQGLNKWQKEQPHRPQPFYYRFNPQSVGLTKGTSSEAWRWWHTQYPYLPQLPPDGYEPPKPQGRLPNKAWDHEFTKAVHSRSDEEHRRDLWLRLSRLILAETQRDGYELRRRDFEGRPTQDYVDPQIINNFVFEEESLRERIVATVVEEEYRLATTSEERRRLKTVKAVIDFVMCHVTTSRTPRNNDVASAVKDILATHPLQPLLGFAHALPEDPRPPLLRAWESQHQLKWQFGHAEYAPRDIEVLQGNLTWLREEAHNNDRKTFQNSVATGEAWKRHQHKIAQAAAD